MILGQWLAEAFKPKQFFKFQRNLETNQVLLVTLGFTQQEDRYHFHYIERVKGDQGSISPTSIQVGESEYCIENSYGQVLRPDCFAATMMLQYFLEKGVDLKDWEAFDTEETTIMVHSCTLPPHAVIDSTVIDEIQASTNPGFALNYNKPINYLAFDKPQLLRAQDLQEPLMTELPCPFTRVPIVAYWSKIELYDYWKNIDEELKNRNLVAGQNPPLGIESLAPDHLESLRSFFKPGIHLAYVTYETTNNLQLKCQLIHKNPAHKETGIMIMKSKEKIGPHGLRNFSEFIGYVDSEDLDENSTSPLSPALREALPTLSVEGFWPKRDPGAKLSPVVYHSSGLMGLTVIEPRVSTHGEPWVYATFDPLMSAAFLSGIGGDFTCAVLRCDHTGTVIINERFEGAFDLRYGHKAGCIYTLDNRSFIRNQTDWPEELVAQGPQRVLESVEIEDVAHYLRQLEEQGRLIIIKYPHKHKSLPDDEGDLVERGAAWTVERGPWVLEDVKRYHPQLLDRVVARIKELEGSESDQDRIRRLLFGE